MGETLNIFNIQRYSLHDGEGIRTVFFLKGCPLHCRWCCNPESQHSYPEVMYRRQLCIGTNACGRCLSFTQKDGHPFAKESDDGKVDLLSDRRGECLSICECCPAGALYQAGKEYAIEDLLVIAEKDAAFYGDDGGITLSGGEPLMQENAITFLKKAKEEYLHTAVETCGAVPEERLLQASRYLDQIFMDIKSVDSEKHKEYTGQTGEQIRRNLKALCENYPQDRIVVRTPVIPGFNDRTEELEAIERFLATFPNITWQKLPYHTYGAGKYEMLGRTYSLQPETVSNQQADL